MPAPQPLVDKLDHNIIVSSQDSIGGTVDAVQDDTDYLKPPSWLYEPLGYHPLNASDFNVLAESSKWLPKSLTPLLRSIHYRVKTWPKRFARPRQNYAANACLVAMSDFEKKDRFCRCGTIGSSAGTFRGGRCGLWTICPYCSHKKRIEVWRKYLPKFSPGRWWFMTISPTVPTNLNICNVIRLTSWWEACRYALTTMIAEGDLRGAFVYETIAVDHYWPVAKSRPHVHAVLLADAVDRGTVQRLKELLHAYQGQVWDSTQREWLLDSSLRLEPLWCKPSTRTYPIRRPFDFASILGYMCNPVNFARAYLADWSTVAGDPVKARSLNENHWDALDAWCAAMDQRWGHKYFGALQHAHRDFTGVAKKKRQSKSFQLAIKLKLMDCQVKRQILFDPDDLGEPVEFQDEVG